MAVKVNPRVAIIDDSEVVLDGLGHTFERHGFEVVRLGSPIAASLALAFQPPDCILIDLNMTTMRGTECLLKLRKVERLKNARFVLFSGDPEDVVRAAAHECNADAWLQKDQGPEHFVDTVRRLLKRIR